MKARIKYSICVVLAIALGLSTRKFSAYLPQFVSVHFGDAIWAAMIYFGFRFLKPKGNLVNAFGASLLFCYLIELSQLYQAPWINQIRNTVAGALILGKGFLFIDLVRYLAGIIMAFLLDRYLLSSKRKYEY